MSLRAFIAGHLDADEAAARATLIDVSGSDDWHADERPVALTVDLYRVRDANSRPVVEEIRTLDDDDDPDNITQYVNGKAVAQHVARHDPARILRQVAAGRDTLERHFTDDDPRWTQYCHGCPTAGDGFPDNELDECPELQALAWYWADDPEWSPKWCPHLEGRRPVEVTEVQDHRPCYTNACVRCGQGDGWHYRNSAETT